MGVTTTIFILVLVQSILKTGANVTENFLRKGYTYLEDARAFYKINTYHSSWFAAERYCESDGATLFYPKNEDEAREVLAFWKDQYPSLCCVHIGISDLEVEGSFVTIDDKPIDDVYHHWDVGEPNRLKGNEHCLTMTINGKLNDDNCYNNYACICKKEIEDENNVAENMAMPVTTYPEGTTPLIDLDTKESSFFNTEQTTTDTHHTMMTQPTPVAKDRRFFRRDYTYLDDIEGFYKLHTVKRTWPEAKRVCELEGATLFYPENEKEAREVMKLCEQTEPQFYRIYIGISDLQAEGEFVTVDGRPVADVYNNWEFGAPNYAYDLQDCVSMPGRLSGQLENVRCDNVYPFICRKTVKDLLNQKPNNNNQQITRFSRKDYTFLKSTKSSYKIHTDDAESWFEARRQCAQEGATLFYPENELEAKEVIKFWKQNPSDIGSSFMYIGISYSTRGVFETIDGQPFSKVYNNWIGGYPKHYEYSAECAVMYNDNRQHSVRCDGTYIYICKRAYEDNTATGGYNMPTEKHSTTGEKLSTTSEKTYMPSKEHKTPSVEHNTPSVEHNTTSEKHNTPSVEHNTTSVEHNAPSEEHNAPSEEHNTPGTIVVLVFLFLLLIAVGVLVVRTLSRNKGQLLNCSFFQNIPGRRRPAWQTFDRQNSVLSE